MNISELQRLFEAISLKDNETVLNSKMTKEMLDIQKNNINAFKESYIHYKEIIKKYSYLVKQLDLKKSLEVCILFTYLLWNGYFSVTRENKYTNNGLLSINGLFALDIMRGRGVCVNHSAMLRDFLNECGYESATLANIYDNDTKVYVNTSIKRKVEKEKKFSKVKSFILLPISTKYGNHEFNLINENGNLYAYDCTNMLLLNIRSVDKAFVVNGRGVFKLSSYTSYIFNLPQKSRNVLKMLYSTNDFYNPYTRNSFLELSSLLTKLLDNNKELLEYYYNWAREDIIFVASSMDDVEEKKIRF